MNNGFYGMSAAHLVFGGNAVSTVLTADVTMTTGGTFYDGPQLTLQPGTWLLIGTISVRPNPAGSTTSTSKLWDGVNVFSAAEQVSGNTNFINEFTHTAVVTPIVATTYRIAATNTSANALIKASTVQSPTAGASSLVAVPIAVP